MRISRKIGLSFFITFLLVISLGILSIYSLRHIYEGLSAVFAKDLPASRATYETAISMKKALTELNNFLLTGNENFRINYERSYKKMAENISGLKRFIFNDEEKLLFGRIEGLAGDINNAGKDIIKSREEMKALFGDLKKTELEYRRRLDALIDFEEKKMLESKDLLLIQAQYVPASRLIMEADSRFSDLLDLLGRYVIRDEEDIPSAFTDDLSMIEKSISDYKNYYGYSLSDRERAIASELVDLTGEIKIKIDSIVDLKRNMKASLGLLLDKETEFMEALDSIIAFKKNDISSKLGVGAALTEDIPAIHNISELEKDIIESWRLTGRYLLTSNESYRHLYYQLRQQIDKELKDYGRHARLRDTEKFLNEIIESDNKILEAVDSNMEFFDKKNRALSDLLSVKRELEEGIDAEIDHKDSIIKEAKSQEEILKNVVPSKWTLAKLKHEISDAHKGAMNYLDSQEPQYKDIYSEMYFSMKKYMGEYRPLSVSERDLAFTKQIEMGLDRFNSDILALVEYHDAIIKARAWTLVKLEEALEQDLDEAVQVELSQIEKNKNDIRNRVAVINTLILFIIGGVALIAVFIIFYTTRSITNPIQELYNGAEVIGSGNLDHRLNIKTGDEIQDLAEGFNKMAGELKELYTNLENKVKERTVQLAEANNALELKNKELDDFTYIVSHDLKEPLRGVKAFTKLLLEDYSQSLDKEAKEHLKIISESTSRMTRLIEDLLNLSRIGRVRNIEEGVDLNEVLSDVKKNLAYSLEEKGADLKIKENFPKVTCDRIRISEVFSNLISNAIKYSKKDRKPVIEIGYSDRITYHEFYVKDNGIGIEKQYYDRIFQIFQRLHAKGEYEGTGAGLTIVKKIVENHGGRVWVESEVDAGSTFYFMLPKDIKRGV